jgi:hypothetical protein
MTLELTVLLAQFATNPTYNNPTLIFKLKSAFTRCAVAGPWMKWDSTDTARIGRTRAKHRWVRMTPVTVSRDNPAGEEPVARVFLGHCPQQPLLEDPDQDSLDLHEEEMDEWEKELAIWHVTPWIWSLEWSDKSTTSGRAASAEEAMDIADDMLRGNMWLLVDPDLVMLANVMKEDRHADERT